MEDYKIRVSDAWSHALWARDNIGLNDNMIEWYEVNAYNYNIANQQKEMKELNARNFKVVRIHDLKHETFTWWSIEIDNPILRPHSNFLHSQGYCDVQGTVYTKEHCEEMKREENFLAWLRTQF